MTKQLLFAILMALTCAVLLGFVLPVPAHAWSKCQYFSDGREPRCHVVSDGAREPYVVGRRQRPGASWQRYRESIRSREEERGRTHTSDMATGGTKMGGMIVSPFVPGSDADRSWQAERKRRGLCGNDRLCLNQ
jgi:hypothetical protein